jgi:hypothetical protein
MRFSLKSSFLILSLCFLLGGFQVSYAANADQSKASEDLNTIIVDSYTARLDKVLQQLYINIDSASKWNKYLQIRALEKVRNDLDERLDIIAESKLSTNRKKILVGVYLYLKTDIELRIKNIELK